MWLDIIKEGLVKLKLVFEGLVVLGGFDDVVLQKYYWVEKINYVYIGGNSLGIVDGVVLVMIGFVVVGKLQGLILWVCIVVIVISGVDLVIMFIGFILVICKVFDCVGLIVDDIDLFEFNEVFVLVVLKFQKDFNIFDEKFNVNGGVIVMGYLLGVIGVMILGIMVDELECCNV